MSEHTPTPWKVFTTPDGRKLVGIGSEEGQGILDCGFGVWAWNDAEGIANAEMVVKAVNNHAALVKALERIAHHKPTMSDFPHDAQGFQMMAFDALMSLTSSIEK